MHIKWDAIHWKSPEIEVYTFLRLDKNMCALLVDGTAILSDLIDEHAILVRIRDPMLAIGKFMAFRLHQDPLAECSWTFPYGA